MSLYQQTRYGSLKNKNLGRKLPDFLFVRHKIILMQLGQRVFTVVFWDLGG